MDKVSTTKARAVVSTACLRMILLGCIAVLLGSTYSLHALLATNGSAGASLECVGCNPSILTPQEKSIPSSATFSRVNETAARYAYTFLLAGCDPERPSYRGFLLNIIISTHLIRSEFHSKADVVVMIRLKRRSKHTSLPPSEESWLRKVGAKIIYLPNGGHDHETESFRQVQFLKFHILELTQYRRVLYLDADVMPVCNLDYLFDLSEKGVIQDNLVVAWTKEPANGGFFMLRPWSGGYQQILDIIARQKENSKHLPPPQFDKIVGWGQPFASDDSDKWYSFQRRQSGHKWSFYASWADQGLLYHYVKFVQRSVTIVLGKRVQNWKPESGGGNRPVLSQELIDPFANYTCRGRRKKEPHLLHPAHGNNLAVQAPYSDFVHFYSVFKPWASTGQTLVIPQEKKECEDVTQYWFFLLRRLNILYDMEIPLDNQQSWRDYAAPFQQAPMKDNRVPSLADLAKQNISIHDY